MSSECTFYHHAGFLVLSIDVGCQKDLERNGYEIVIWIDSIVALSRTIPKSTTKIQKRVCTSLICR